MFVVIRVILHPSTALELPHQSGLPRPIRVILHLSTAQRPGLSVLFAPEYRT
jgi:hypothetical protein